MIQDMIFSYYGRLGGDKPIRSLSEDLLNEFKNSREECNASKKTKSI